MVDSERLITLIKSMQCLWNTTANDYYNKNLKEASWNSICQELIEDWSALSEEDKSFKQNDIKKRWNNIRDYYTKEIKLQKKERFRSSSRMRKEYVYAGILDFLRPIVERKNNKEECKTVKQQAEKDPLITTAAATSSIYIPAASISNLTPSRPTDNSKRKAKKRKLQALQSKSSVASVAGSSIRRHKDDPDLLFLKSLLPDVKVLTRSQKIDFKIGIMKLLKSIRTSKTSSASPTNFVSRTGTPTDDSSDEENYIFSNDEEYPNIDESDSVAATVELGSNVFSDLIQIKIEDVSD